MLKRIFTYPYNRFRRLYSKQIDGLGLEIFRIFFFACLLGDVSVLLKYHNLIFDRIPFIQPYELSLWPALVVWILALISIIVGYKTRLALWANYLFCIVFIANVSTYEYHMYYIYVTVSLVSVFIPFGRRLSIDNYLQYRKNHKPFPTTTSAFNYFILLFTGIGLTYADSVFHKFVSHIWLNGLGVWLPSSIPQIVIRDFTPLLNMKGLMIFLGYFTLAFEAAFIFIFWIKPVRFWLFLIGIGLHICIALVYPIPYFGLGMSALYLLFLPVKYWKYLFRKWAPAAPSIPEENSIRKQKVNLAFAGTLFLMFMQGLFIYYSPVMGSIKKRVPLAFIIPDLVLAPISSDLKTGFAKFFGFHQHGVFVDGHFTGYDHNISIVHTGHPPQLLPLNLESGMVGSYQSGPLWAKWGFRANGPRIDSTRLINGARDFSLQWMHDNNLPFDNQSFNLVFKRNECPTKWEKDFLENQLKQPWVKFGSFHWKDQKLYVDSVNFGMLYAPGNPFAAK